MMRWIVLFMSFVSVCLPASVAGQPDGDPIASVHPCELVFHGRDFIYPNPELPDKSLPLSHGENLPVEFYLHADIPRQYRPVMHAAAAELNMRVGFRMIAIRSEIDRGDMYQRWDDFRSVIYWDDYWANSGGTELTAEVRTMEAARVEIRPVAGTEPWIAISEVDIMVYGEKPNTAAGRLRIMLARTLRRLGVEPLPGEDVDLAVLQSMVIERLSTASEGDFHDMVIQLMSEMGVELPDAGEASVQDWILDRINEERRGAEPLGSFDDLRRWLIEEFSVDVDRFGTSVILKNHMLHEFGHAVGLRHYGDADNLMAERAYRIPVTPGVPVDLLAEREFDDLAVHGLRCTYDLGRLRQSNPL